MMSAVIVVLIALTATAQGSVVPLVLGGPSPIVYSTTHGSGYPSIAVHSAVLPTGLVYHSTPITVPAPIVLGTEGTYTAKTLGSEHVATLPGHINSATSVNLELAAGTKPEDYQLSSGLPSSTVAIQAPALSAPFYVRTAHVIVPAPVVLPTEGTYVAKTLGSEHIAPLPGHIISTSSVNLQPAPGTEKKDN